MDQHVYHRQMYDCLLCIYHDRHDCLRRLVRTQPERFVCSDGRHPSETIALIPLTPEQAKMVHDLRTPLACIIGALETIEQMRGKLSPEQTATLLALALSEARRMNGSLDKLTPE